MPAAGLRGFPADRAEPGAHWVAGSMTGWRENRSRIPWLRDYQPAEGYEPLTVLDDETHAFDDFTAGGRGGGWRAPLLDSVREAVAAACPAASVHYGPASSAGIVVPQAPLDVVVAGCTDAAGLRAELERRGAEAALWSDEIHLRLDSKPAVIQLCEVGDATLGLCTAMHLATRHSASVRRVAKVLTHLLWQSALLGGSGLTPPALVVMVAAVVNTPRTGIHALYAESGAAMDTATLLKETLLLYGADFPATGRMIAATGVAPAAPAFRPARGGVWVCHPVDPAVNIAATCARMPRIQDLMAHCHAALCKWDAPPEREMCGAFFGSKSPLASVIAFNKLAAAYEHAPPLPPPPPARQQPPTPPQQPAAATPHVGIFALGGALAEPPPMQASPSPAPGADDDAPPDLIDLADDVDDAAPPAPREEAGAARAPARARALSPPPSPPPSPPAAGQLTVSPPPAPPPGLARYLKSRLDLPPRKAAGRAQPPPADQQRPLPSPAQADLLPITPPAIGLPAPLPPFLPPPRPRASRGSSISSRASGSDEGGLTASVCSTASSGSGDGTPLMYRCASDAPPRPQLGGALSGTGVLNLPPPKPGRSAVPMPKQRPQPPATSMAQAIQAAAEKGSAFTIAHGEVPPEFAGCASHHGKVESGRG